MCSVVDWMLAAWAMAAGPDVLEELMSVIINVLLMCAPVAGWLVRNSRSAQAPAAAFRASGAVPCAKAKI